MVRKPTAQACESRAMRSIDRAPIPESQSVRTATKQKTRHALDQFPPTHRHGAATGQGALPQPPRGEVDSERQAQQPIRHKDPPRARAARFAIVVAVACGCDDERRGE